MLTRYRDSLMSLLTTSSGRHLFAPYIKNLNLPNLTVSAPDMGGSKRANAYARYLQSEMVLCYKLRKKPNVVEEISIIGEVEGRHVVIIDDLVDTAGTLTFAATVMKDRGALSVRAVATHPVLSGDAIDKIDESPLEELVVTDSIPLLRESPKIKSPFRWRNLRRGNKSRLYKQFYQLRFCILTFFAIFAGQFLKTSNV